MNRKKLMDVGIVMRDVKQLLKATHTVKQKAFSYNYKGLDLTHSCVLAGSLSIKESMKKKNVEWASEEHGIEMLDTILMKIFQLGYEQRQIELDIEIRKYGDPIEIRKKVFLLLKENNLTPQPK